MKKNSYTKIFLIFSFISLIKVPFVFANEIDSCANASNGMTYNEVLASCGKPLEKIEYETKHEDLWVYKYYSLRFKEGKLLLEGNEKKISTTQKMKEPFPKEEKKEIHEWGALEPINENVSFEEIITSDTPNKKPAKSIQKFPPPLRRR